MRDITVFDALFITIKDSQRVHKTQGKNEVNF